MRRTREGKIGAARLGPESLTQARRGKTVELEQPGVPATVLFHESYFTQLYGAQQSLLNLISHLDPSRYEPILVCPAEGKFTRQARSLGIEVVISPLPGALMEFSGGPLRGGVVARAMLLAQAIPQVINLARMMRSRDIRLMHCNSERSMLTSGWAAKLARVPLVWHVRSDVALGHVDTVARMMSTAIICVSHDVERTLRGRRGWADSPKMTTILNGIPLERFDPATAKDGFRQECGFPDEAIVVGSVSSLTLRKRVHHFIRMAQSIAADHSNVRFVIVGDLAREADAAYKRSLIESAAGLVEAGTLVFAGWRDDLSSVYNAMDIVVLASSSEGLPRVVIEAMAMGKPVVQTSAAGATDTTVDGETGFVVPVDDVPALTQGVAKLVDSPSMRIGFGLAARERAVKEFSVARVASSVDGLFAGLIGFGGDDIKSV